MKNKPPIITSLFDRQEILSDVAGYYAPTHRELSEALTIAGAGGEEGVNQHFQEIYRRQQYNRVKRPENAIVAVTKEYLTNYRSAEAITRQLGALAIEINDIVNPKITLADEIASLMPGHRAFVRYLDLKNAYSIEDGEEEQRRILERAYFRRDFITSSYIDERLGEVKIKDARKLILESIKDQNNRSIFWRNTLKSVQSHRIAGPVIMASLRD